MSSQALSQGVLTLKFDQDYKASAIIVAPETKASEVLKKLGLVQGCKVILLTGSAAPFDEGYKVRITALFDQGIAAAADENTVIIDGATQEGVSELIGQSISNLEQKPILLGVAPRGKVYLPGSQEDRTGKHPLDPNHTHFVLVDADQWQGATEMMFDLAEALGSSQPPTPPPQYSELEPPKPKPRLIMLLVGGSPDNVSIDEALACVRRGWTLMVVEGSGRLADIIARSWKKKERISRQMKRWWLRPIAALQQRQLEGEDPRLKEIIQKGKIQVFPKRNQPQELMQQLEEQIAELDLMQESILHQAWKRYTLYSFNAKRNQQLFRNFRNVALILAWVTTLMALLQQKLIIWVPSFVENPPNIVGAQRLAAYLALLVTDGSGQVANENIILANWLHFIIVLLPIITAALLTAENRLKSGNKWIALRAAAEAILGGIYSYRVMACCPDEVSGDSKRPRSAEGLAQYLRKITTGLVQTEVTDTALSPSPETIPPSRFQKMDDDGFSAMSGEMYVRYRLVEQLDYFQITTNRLERTLRRYRWGIWIFGGLGTLLAALSQEYWLPLTVATVTALTVYLEYQQVEQNLMAGNQSEAALSNVLAWWVSLPVEKRESPENLAKILDDTETILESNVAVWVKQMQAAQEKASVGDNK